MFICFRSDNSWPASGFNVEGANLKFLRKDPELNGLYQCEASNSLGSNNGYLYRAFTSGEVKFEVAARSVYILHVFFAFDSSEFFQFKTIKRH